MPQQTKYRIICSKERFSDHPIIDIAPENGVTHDMMFYSRLQLYRTTSAGILEDYGTRSIYMTVIDGQEPEIDFSYADPGKKKVLEHQAYVKMCDKLRPLILKTYEEMIATGRGSTLEHIMSAVEAENYKDTLNTGNSSFKNFKEKHFADLYRSKTHEPAQSIQEEETLRICGEFAEQRKHREACNEMHAILDQKMSPLERMQQRLSRDGD